MIIDKALIDKIFLFKKPSSFVPSLTGPVSDNSLLPNYITILLPYAIISVKNARQV